MSTALREASEHEAGAGKWVAGGLMLRLESPTDWTARRDGEPSTPVSQLPDAVRITCQTAGLRGVVALGPTVAEQRRMERYTRTERTPFSSNASFRLEFNGAVDAVALQAAATSLVWRHEGLRTAYVRYGEHLLQEVRAAPRNVVQMLENRALRGASDEVVREWSSERASVAFDVGREPPITWCYARRSPRESVLLISLHHLVADGWAWGIILADLQRLYRRLTAGEEVGGPWLRATPEECRWTPIDFAGREAALLTPERIAWIKEEWRRELDGATLSPGYARYRGSYSIGEQIVRTISTDAAKQIKTLARAARVSDATAYLATFAATLCLETDGPDPVVVIASANRRLPQDADLVLCCRNTVPVRCSLEHGEGLLDVFRRMGERILHAMDREAYSIELLESDPPQSEFDAPPPLTTYQHESQASEIGPTLSSWGELDVAVHDVPVGGDARAELSLLTIDSNHGVTGVLEFDTSRIPPAVAERIADRWVAVVEFAATPSQPVDPSRPTPSSR
jgi:Condensation domain